MIPSRWEKTWTHLAKSYDFVESLESFLLDTGAGPQASKSAPSGVGRRA